MGESVDPPVGERKISPSHNAIQGRSFSCANKIYRLPEVVSVFPSNSQFPFLHGGSSGNVELLESGLKSAKGCFESRKTKVKKL